MILRGSLNEPLSGSVYARAEREGGVGKEDFGNGDEPAHGRGGGMRLGLKQLGAGGGILALLVAGLAGGALASRTGDAGAAPCGPGGALDVIGLTSEQRLVCFEANDPAGAATIGALTELPLNQA